MACLPCNTGQRAGDKAALRVGRHCRRYSVELGQRNTLSWLLHSLQNIACVHVFLRFMHLELTSKTLSPAGLWEPGPLCAEPVGDEGGRVDNLWVNSEPPPAQHWNQTM